MKTFLVLSNFPYAKGEAIEIVSDEMIRLAAKAGHEIVVQVIIREAQNPLFFKRMQEAIANLKHLKVTFLEPIFLGDGKNKKGKIRERIYRALSIIISLPLLRRYINPYLFPAMSVAPQMRTRIRSVKPDIILSIWSWEGLAATYTIRGIPKFTYYGNPDHKPEEAWLKAPELFDIPVQGLVNHIKFNILKLFNRARKVQHVKMMKNYNVTANNSLIDAQYYASQGHSRSIYLQNMWPEAKSKPSFLQKNYDTSVVKILGSIGNLGATGNTLGLFYLGTELAPRLEKKFDKESIQIHLYGPGKPHLRVADALSRRSIIIRGWVDDIEEEIRSSHAFLVLTNVNGFIVGNTRILLAWSLGSCLIAHKNSALSMPEINHMENALLGESAEELADLIYQSVKNPDLREKIGRGGYETYQKYYRSNIVVPLMLKEMESCVSLYKNRKNEGLGGKLC